MSALNRFFYSTLSQSNKNPTSLTLENEDNGSKRDTGERVMVSSYCLCLITCFLLLLLFIYLSESTRSSTPSSSFVYCGIQD